MNKTTLIAQYKKNRITYITIGSSLFAIAGIYAMANRYRAKKIVEKIIEKVDAGEGEFGDITDMGWSNPKYLENYPQGSKIGALYPQIALQYAKDIAAAFSWTGDNEEQIYSVIRKIRTQYQLAQVAKNYSVINKTNLADDFKNRLSSDELDIITNIISKMPKY